MVSGQDRPRVRSSSAQFRGGGFGLTPGAGLVELEDAHVPEQGGVEGGAEPAERPGRAARGGVRARLHLDLHRGHALVVIPTAL